MKISAITAKAVAVPLVKPFVVSLGEITSCDSVFVKIETDNGITGYGEGAGVTFVTGETNDTVLGAIKFLTPALLGLDPFSIGHIHRVMDQLLVGNGSAKAALDLALYDIMGKAAKLPLYKLLGGVNDSIETDMTIGLDTPTEMGARAAELAAEGYRHIKVKAGANMANDREAIRLIREAAPAVHIKVDANQGWTVYEALSMFKFYAELGVEAVEQPLPYWDADGLAYLRAHAPIPVMADESCFTPHDAMRLLRRDAADIINIKLMKCGGLYPAMRICDMAEAAGVRCMLGCMLESRLAIAAAAALVASRPNFVYGDLDSFKEFDDSGLIQSAFAFEPPIIRLPAAYGIGVDVNF